MSSNMVLQQAIEHDSIRNSRSSKGVDVLTQIYEPTVNIAIWQRQLSDVVIKDVGNLLATVSHIDTSAFIRVQSINSDIRDAIRSTELGADFLSSIEQLVDMFCTLFDLSQVGLRLRLLDTPMCPRFHVDRVPCRMVTTFAGQGTQWLEHHNVDRSKLGHGSQGLDDCQSGLFNAQENIQSISTGDVALLKGEAWVGNENAGLVHRSPPYCAGSKRLLMTLDFLP